MHIGIDFDNTLVSYDRAFHRRALDRGLISRKIPVAKRAVRDAIRALPRGNRLWTILQGEVYGKYIDEATIDAAAVRFIKRCRKEGIALSIVSHKTAYPAIGGRVSLRKAAFRWMSEHGFFDPAGLAFARRDVHFASTQAGKVRAVARRGCTHFIDDLDEVFSHPAFPRCVAGILFAPDDRTEVGGLVHRCSSWGEIYALIFTLNDNQGDLISTDGER